jgi:hypothetical protein
MELDLNEKPRKRIVLHLVASKDIYSIPIPTDWNSKKLKNFLQVAFKDRIGENPTLFYEGKKLADEFKLNTIMSDNDENFPKILVITNPSTVKETPLEPKRINEIVINY